MRMARQGLGHLPSGGWSISPAKCKRLVLILEKQESTASPVQGDMKAHGCSNHSCACAAAVPMDQCLLMGAAVPETLLVPSPTWPKSIANVTVSVHANPQRRVSPGPHLGNLP